jgi:hypothetical protein
MSNDVTPSAEPYDPDLDPDTDSTMTAPPGGRPDGAPAVAAEDESSTPTEDDAPPDE